MKWALRIFIASLVVAFAASIALLLVVIATLSFPEWFDSCEDRGGTLVRHERSSMVGDLPVVHREWTCEEVGP